MRLLEIDKQSEKARLEAVIADQTAAALAKQQAQDRLRALDGVYAQQRSSVIKQTAGPGEGLIRDLTKTPGQINEAIDQIKVDGLRTLNDELTDAIVNFHSLGDVGQSVLKAVLHDLVAMNVEKYITLPLAKRLFPEQAASVANDNALVGVATGLNAAGGTLTASAAVLTNAAALWAATASQIQLAASALAASGGGADGGSGGSGGGGGGIGGLLGTFAAIFGGGTSASTAASLTPDVLTTIAANPGVFASGTDRVPIGRDFLVGENGVERMRYHSGGRLEVINGPRTHRMAQDGGGGVTLIQNNYIPERVDPRRTAAGLARSTQGALARAARKGLAGTRS